MRVGIDARSLGTSETGPGIYTRQIVERIPRLAPSSTFFLYWGRREAGTRLPPCRNVTERELGLPGGRKLGNLIFEQVLLPAALRRDACDLLWSPVFVVPLRKRTGQIVTMHDTIPLIFAKEATLARRVVYHRLLRINARQSDRILTVSENSARDLVDRLHVDPGKIRVVANGVEDVFRPLGPEERPILKRLLVDLDLREPYFVCTAGMMPRKNAHRVLEGFARATEPRDHGRGTSLVFTGKLGFGGNDDYVASMRDRVRELGLTARVRFVGFLPRSHVRLLYCGARASLDASLYEGFGFPVLESMACGCPVIASNRSSLPEVAGDAALLVDPESIVAIGEAIARLNTDEVLREVLRERGLARAASFSWEESARRTLEVIRDVFEIGALKERGEGMSIRSAA